MNEFEGLTRSQNRAENIKKCIYINNEEVQKDQQTNFNSPYKFGKKNKDYVNPSYISSDAFYPDIQFDSINAKYRPIQNKSPSKLTEQRARLYHTPTKYNIDQTQHDVISYDLFLQQQSQLQPHQLQQFQSQQAQSQQAQPQQAPQKQMQKSPARQQATPETAQLPEALK